MRFNLSSIFYGYSKNVVSYFCFLIFEKAKFKYSGFHDTCEQLLKGLRNCTHELTSQNVEEKANIEKSLENFQKYWESLLQKIEKMTKKLKTLPDSKESFERGLHQLSTSLIEFEQNKRQLNNNDLSVVDYKRLVDKLKVFHLGPLHIFSIEFQISNTNNKT